MKNNVVLLWLLLSGTCAMLLAFYATEWPDGLRNILSGAGMTLFVLFDVAIICRVYRQTAPRVWLFTTVLLPIFGGILYLIVREE